MIHGECEPPQPAEVVISNARETVTVFAMVSPSAALVGLKPPRPPLLPPAWASSLVLWPSLSSLSPLLGHWEHQLQECAAQQSLFVAGGGGAAGKGLGETEGSPTLTASLSVPTLLRCLLKSAHKQMH